jgi:hypothetical protein
MRETKVGVEIETSKTKEKGHATEFLTEVSAVIFSACTVLCCAFL